MNIRKSVTSIFCILITFFVGLFFSGCAGQKEYYSAIKSQNETIQKLNAANAAKEAEADRKHEEQMTLLLTNSMVAAAATPDKTDDVLIPLLIMSFEDKRVMAKALSNNNDVYKFQVIEAPESAGDFVRKSSSALLGVGAIVSGIIQSNNTKDIAVEGLKASGSSVSGDNNSVYIDSYKSGSQNTTSGSISAGDINENVDNQSDVDNSTSNETDEDITPIDE